MKPQPQLAGHNGQCQKNAVLASIAMRTAPPNVPEILAPAGSEEALSAALASGADAIYLGLAEGFNARGRSTAFHLADLTQLVERAHRANAKLYLTLNTLVFEDELEQLDRLLSAVVQSGVDALIIQDPATAFLARAHSPELHLHASTQMTVSSAEGARFAASLGMIRVVLPRELSTEEIAQFIAQSPLEAEVFVHGALCMAWSGQCLTSEAFSGRSANRGQCSQACRMPYEVMVDGQRLELGDLRYLLSPQDLAAHAALPALMKAGVRSLKIEGRYKGAPYVCAAVDSWRSMRDAVATGQVEQDHERLEMEAARARLTFSRGGSVGFLVGDNHQTLVVGTTPKHRGLALGEVSQVRRRSVLVALDCDPTTRALLRPGVGIKFEPVGRTQAEHDPERDPGGPLFGLEWCGTDHLELKFGQPGPDLSRLRPRDLVRLTGDPEITREAERRLKQPLPGRIALRLTISGQQGGALSIEGHASALGRSLSARVETQLALQPARNATGLDDALLQEKLGALGGTPFFLERVDQNVPPGLYMPVSELKDLRRRLVAALEEQLIRPRAVQHAGAPLVHKLRAQLATSNRPLLDPPQIIPLCRTKEQLEAVIESAGGCGEVELDWMEMVGLSRAVERAKTAGLRVTLATVRVQKPGEEAFDRRIAALDPQGVLVRHWGALMHFSSQEARAPDTAAPTLHGDFSLNVTNSLTAHHLLNLGLTTVTASHDLNQTQLLDLLAHVPEGRVALTLHHHIPTFHNSHCVYAHVLSKGTDYRNCGRPCEEHRLALRDYAGHDHPVLVDVSCRNTVFSALAQSAAPLVPELLKRGVRRFRVEFVWESAQDVTRVLVAYQRLLLGQTTPAAVLEATRVHERYGVTIPLRLNKRSLPAHP